MKEQDERIQRDIKNLERLEEYETLVEAASVTKQKENKVDYYTKHINKFIKNPK